MQEIPSSNEGQRLFALDVFRGFTIIGMIVVNSPNTFGQLSHAHWEGVMLADLVFPFFIFIVGVAISLGLRKFNPEISDRKPIIKKILTRTLILFALGMAVNLLYTHFSAIRVLGVLQRIALVYCICSLMGLYLSQKQLIYSGFFILISYWLLVLFVPPPGLEAGTLLRGENVVNWFDSRFLPGMLWRGTWDPEGILSTYPAVVSGIIGMLVGNIIVRSKDLTSMVVRIFVVGFVCFASGYCWSFFFPMIKQIWSSSFVLVTGGLACMVLATLLWYTDIKHARRGTYVGQVFGANAITAYVLHVVIEKLFDLELAGHSVQGTFVGFFNALGINAVISTTLWIFVFIAACFIPIQMMYKRKIFVKI